MENLFESRLRDGQVLLNRRLEQRRPIRNLKSAICNRLELLALTNVRGLGTGSYRTPVAGPGSFSLETPDDSRCQNSQGAPRAMGMGCGIPRLADHTGRENYMVVIGQRNLISVAVLQVDRHYDPGILRSPVEDVPAPGSLITLADLLQSLPRARLNFHPGRQR